MNNPSEIERLRRQQGALADFGTFAFRENDLQIVLTEAARICAESLDVPFAKICRYRPMRDELLVVAGVGWRSGVIGYVVSAENKNTTQGRAFVTHEPVIVEDFAKSSGYALPAFYAEHRIVSTADVLIKSEQGSWGVLEVDSSEQRTFDHHDIVFMTGFANVLAEAVTSAEQKVALRETIDQMKALIVEKDLLLGEREGQTTHLHELQSELLHVSRLNAMGQMTAAIAHELNQPLAAIANYVGAAKLALGSIEGNSDRLSFVQEMIDNVEEQTLRAGKIIKNLRDMVEKRESRYVSEDLEVVVREAMGVVLFGASERIRVNLIVGADIPPVWIDRVQIQQILFNLVRNSVEAMGQSKNCELTITIRLGDPGFVDVTVQDSGPGLADGVVGRLFQPFVTTKSDGMGLGLMICQTLAEANGGRIWRLDDLITGTAFRFCLPIAIAPDEVLPLVA